MRTYSKNNLSLKLGKNRHKTEKGIYLTLYTCKKIQHKDFRERFNSHLPIADSNALSY